MRRMVVSVALFFGVGQITACSSDEGGGPKPIPLVLTTLTVTLSTSSVQVGRTAVASAAGLDQNGSAIATGTLSWASSSPAIAIVTSTGSITATSAGQTQIVASAGGRSAQATFTVTAIPVTTTIVVSLSSSSVVQGATVTATAVALDQNGLPLADRTVVWSTGASGIASVSSTGLVTGVAAGQTPVIATIDGKQGALPVTVTPTPIAAVIVTPATVSLVIGGTQQLAAATVDANNNTLLGRVIAWTSSDSTKARVSSDGLVSAVAIGAATITATSEGKSGASAITVGSLPVATVTMTPASATIAVGGTQVFTATARDANGNILTGRLFAFTSSNLSVVTGSFTLNVLTATGVGAGAATITATSEGKAGTAAVTVGSVPVATVTVTPATASILVGGTQLLTATARDTNGIVLSGRTFTWTTTSSNIASSTFVGNVLTATGVGVGTATFTATSEGKSGSSVVTVAAAAPVIASVSPSTLTPGGTVTIAGTGFASVPASNTVRIGGAVAVILSGSATQLIATVPCVVGGAVPVVVSIGSATSNSVSANLVGTTQTLSVGQSVALLAEAAVRCNELALTGGRYLISVFNTSIAPSANTPVVISGSYTMPPSGASIASSTPMKPLSFPRRAPLLPSLDAARDAASARAHGTMLERSRQIAESFRNAPGRAAALSAARARASAAVVVPPTVGSNVTLHYGGFTSSGCNTFSNITARVVAVTTHSIVLEDNSSPTAGQVDTDMVALGQLFESTLYPIEANFGDINVWDVPGGLDNPGRVLMLFTPSENQPFPTSGILLGHVTACDLIPTALAGYAGSNQTKIFYARVPKFLTGSAYTLDTRAYWNAVMPGTLVHEAKHITSNAERFSRNGTVYEESWLEEATAQIAPEIYSRKVYAGSSWKGNTTYLNSIYCDSRIGTAQCPNGQQLMANHLSFLQDYYENNESKSILSPGTVDPDIYGSAWMFVRWLVDQYGGATESTLLRSLVQEGNLAGVANVTAKTGATFAGLLADWTMTLVADDYPGFTAPAGAKYTFPSWNTRSIWAGYNADRGPSNPVFPLNVSAVTFGHFSLSGTLPGAAAGIIELSGVQTAKQLLDLSGLPQGTTIRMSILRVQ